MSEPGSNQTQRLVLLIAGTVAAVAALYYFAVRPFQASIADLRSRSATAAVKISGAQRASRFADRFKTELGQAEAKLAEQETAIAQGDIYRWLINAFLDYKSKHHIEFTEFEQPQISDLSLPPNVAYKGATFAVTGMATYHEFGKFLADFENDYPLVRLESLQLDLASTIQTNPAAPGKLNFRVQLLALVKPPPPPAPATPAGK